MSDAGLQVTKGRQEEVFTSDRFEGMMVRVRMRVNVRAMTRVRWRMFILSTLSALHGAK